MVKSGKLIVTGTKSIMVQRSILKPTSATVCFTDEEPVQASCGPLTPDTVEVKIEHQGPFKHFINVEWEINSGKAREVKWEINFEE